MNRYYFNFRDGAEYLDEEGTELPNLEDVRAQAVLFCAEALREVKGSFWAGEPWRVWVTDESGATVCEINLSSVS
jgi:hypothetical protein